MAMETVMEVTSFLSLFRVSLTIATPKHAVHEQKSRRLSARSVFCRALCSLAMEDYVATLRSPSEVASPQSGAILSERLLLNTRVSSRACT